VGSEEKLAFTGEDGFSSKKGKAAEEKKSSGLDKRKRAEKRQIFLLS